MPGPRRGVLLAALIIVVVFGLADLISLSLSIDGTLARLRRAESDNTTWLIAQGEVDLLKYALALDDVSHEPSPQNLDRLHQDFDILFSRVAVIGESLPKLDLLAGTRVVDRWSVMESLVARHAATFDLGNAEVLANVAHLEAEARAARPLVRGFALDVLQFVNTAAMARREQVGWLLNRFIITRSLTFLMLAALGGLLLVSLRQMRRQAIALERVGLTLRRTIDASQDAVLLADAGGRVRTYNRAAEQMFGQPRNLAVDGDLGALFTLAPDAAGNDVPPSILSLPEGDRRRASAIRPGGPPLPVEVTLAADTDGEGRPINVVFARDISEQLAAEDALRAARDAALRGEEAKLRFLAVMSHEMRTPLNGLIAALDIVQKTTRPSRRQERFLAIARQCAETAQEQIDDVLELTRLDGNAPPEKVEPFDVIAAVREIVEQNRAFAEQRGNRLVLTLPEGDRIAVLGQRRLLTRAVFNLLGNAIKFTAGGRVDLRLTVRQGHGGRIVLRCEISDTGIGIAEDKLGTIFRDFETIDKSYSRRAEGTGLGLGIAKRAVERMGGRIGVASTLGQGSTFWFEVELPTAGNSAVPAPAAPAIPDATAPDRGRLRVLIAEDNATNRLVLVEMLRHLGCCVDAARNGLEAIALAEATAYDLVLMDISMPEMNGIEAARRIRQAGRSRDARLIALTAHALPDEVEAMHAAGLTEVIPKPVTIGALRALTGAGAQAPAWSDDRPLVAPQQLEELRAMLPPDGVSALIHRFIDETGALLRALQHEADPARAADIAHRAAGGAAALGALGLHTVLTACEDRLRKGDGAAAVEGWPELAACWEATRDELSGRLDPARPGHAAGTPPATARRRADGGPAARSGLTPPAGPR